MQGGPGKSRKHLRTRRLLSAGCARTYRHVQPCSSTPTTAIDIPPPYYMSRMALRSTRIAFFHVAPNRDRRPLLTNLRPPPQPHGSPDVPFEEIKGRCGNHCLPHTLRYPMICSSPQSVPLDFEPDSIYLVFVMRSSRPCAGVFHHNSDNKGILAYADVGIPGPWKSHRKVFSFELKKSKCPASNPEYT